MGAGRSKSFPISYDEATRRVSPEVLQRLHETFKRQSTVSGYLPGLTFMKDILGDNVPAKLAEAMFEAFGGTSKGIGYKDLVCGLVLLAHGTKNEKARFIGQMVCGEHEKVTREKLDSLVTASDLQATQVDLDTLFKDGSTSASLDVFESWVLEHLELASFTTWLLGSEGTGVELEGAVDPPSSHEILAQRYYVPVQVVMDIERTYWALKGGSGRFDQPTLASYVEPPLTPHLSQDLFRVMDLNLDGHIDLPELIQTVAELCCRETTPHNFCFKLFDSDSDGVLSPQDISSLVEQLSIITEQNMVGEASPDAPISADSAQEYCHEKEGHMTLTEYSDWMTDTGYDEPLIKVLTEVCHVKFGLRPSSPQLEGEVVNGYLHRFRRAGRNHGDTVYIMAHEWFSQWKNYTAQEEEQQSFSKPAKKKRKGKSRKVTTPPQSGENGEVVIRETRPGPIDNSVLCVAESSNSKKLPSLTNEGGRLVRAKLLMEDKDYVVVPEVVWRVFVGWYGNTGYSPLALPRLVNSEGVVELYPLVFKLYRHTTAPQPSKPSPVPWPFHSLLNSLGLVGSTQSPSGPVLPATGDESPAAPQPRRVPYYQAAFPSFTTIAQFSEVVQNMLRVKSEDLRLYDFSKDTPTLIEDESATLEALQLKDGQNILVETRNKDNSWPEEIIAIMKEVIVKDKPKAPPTSAVKVPQGATGLSNLGNTCFMNSALQCISNTRALTVYFRERDHLTEINKENPLGTGGVLAKRYAELVDDLWTGNSKSITPLKFRFTVGRFAPQFNGFQQQDCQELLAFLLDGLHEDLNRVKEKAYRELSDSDGRPDSVVAQEAWDYHLSRNKSVIVDLFHGQLKSVVTCKVCSYSSTRFDPFTFLSLPLPMDNTINLEVIVVLLDGSQPLRYGLKLELDDKYRQAKKALAELCGLSHRDMILVEVYGGIIRSIPSDSTKIRSVLGGWLYAYEIPPPPLLNPTSRADSPDQPMRLARAQRLTKLQDQSQNTQDEEMDTESVDPETQEMDVTSPDSHVTEPVIEKPTTPDSTMSCDQESRTHEPAGLDCSEGFVFAVHRRIFTVENYFVVAHKSRPIIFGTPLVVPCEPGCRRDTLYTNVWQLVQRLMIPDPPNTTRSPEHAGQNFPFVLKIVSKDGVTCALCPWYRFCTGCLLPCDDGVMESNSGYIAVDWDSTTLHLKYQSAQERPLEHPSMEGLKVINTQPINLVDCFKSFGRQEELGDEECWYCKQCKTHREAVKTLGIWKLPPILIIHLKRFQFHNGRWVKSQRDVNFPLEALDPLANTAAATTPARSAGSTTMTPEQAESHDIEVVSHDIASSPVQERHDLAPSPGQESPDEEAMTHDPVPQSPDTDIELGDLAAQLGNHEPKPGSPQPEEISPYDPNLYNLFAICCHSGVMGGGHYVSFAKNPNKNWYYFNDSSCKETSEARVLEESPYLLFYESRALNHSNYRSPSNRRADSGQDDDSEFEETIKSLRKTCTVQ